MSQVRVRFAPSPTGFFHIGSARTALFNWLYARHTGGVFILRVEDTDHSRNSEEFLNVIYGSLKWLGLNWDEGPGVGGAFGPYRQSERSAIYKEYLERLRASGRTYEKDGATVFKISGEPQVIEDAIRGRVERTEEKDFVIVRSDGNPVFHFVNVVDDIAMKVTHVIRGEDHLSNTSKHTELFKALGAPLPIYAHIPLILKQNGPGKMSKRDQGALIEEYQKRGFIL
ncbi:MAG TPA: glutamate--tRNA ligase family protein, partial [Opitutaceae bacterium]